MKVWIYRPDRVIQERMKNYLYSPNGLTYRKVRELEEDKKRQESNTHAKKDYQIEVPE